MDDTFHSPLRFGVAAFGFHSGNPERPKWGRKRPIGIDALNTTYFCSVGMARTGHRRGNLLRLNSFRSTALTRSLGSLSEAVVQQCAGRSTQRPMLPNQPFLTDL